MNERLRKIVYKNKEVLIVDYSDLKEEGMIEVFSAAKELVLRENKKVLVLSVLNHRNYASPKFIRHVEEGLREAEQLIVKNAVTGMSDVQRWIIKGINLWYKSQLHPFESTNKALDFLVS